MQGEEQRRSFVEAKPKWNGGGGGGKSEPGKKVAVAGKAETERTTKDWAWVVMSCPEAAVGTRGGIQPREARHCTCNFNINIVNIWVLVEDGVHTTSTAEETGHLLGFVPGKHLRNKHLSLIFCANYSENKSRAVVQDNGENTLMRKEIKITKSCSLSLGHWIVILMHTWKPEHRWYIFKHNRKNRRNNQTKMIHFWE